MNALRLIRNPRTVLKLSAKRWPSNLPPPVYASDTRNKELAVSALCSLIMRDGQRIHCCDLTNEQAEDISRLVEMKDYKAECEKLRAEISELRKHLEYERQERRRREDHAESFRATFKQLILETLRD